MGIFLFRKRRGAANRGQHAKALCLERLEDRTLLASLTIAQENQLPGTPESVWDNINGIGDPKIQGYATNMSVNVGQTESFKINDTANAAYQIKIYRIGYYQGNGARLVATIPSSQTLVQAQPNPLHDSSTGMYDAGNWAVSASWAVPSDATSGVYLADVVRNDTGGMSQIVFVVRNDASHSDILFKTSDATWQAYNDWGGNGQNTDPNGAWLANSLYTGNNLSTSGPGYSGAAYAVSYNRPLNNRGNTSITNIHDQFFYAEYPMVRWLEANGYDVSYTTDVAADQNGSLLLNHKIDLSVGHDEYWSAAEYNNFMAARNAGVNLALFSGNEAFWKTRWANSIDGSNTPYRTLVDYKETHANAVIDPADPPTWTGTKEDPRFSPPADGGIDQNQLTGTFFTVNQGVDPTGSPITVPGTDANLRFWRNTAIAGLQPNQSMNIGGQVLGYEWDEDIDDGSRPSGLIDLSSTTEDVNGPGGQNLQKFVDYGNTVLPRKATHSLTLYRASSGALVFGAGTVQWSWGLDSDHDGSDNLPDPDVNMQQATVNLFADMGNVQPATLQSGLVAATASTDKTPPTSAITSPTSNAALQCGTPVTITGTATDTGGHVAGVEVSVDGGQTWHPAQGQPNGTTYNWTYTWTTGAPGNVTIRSRAVDDSGNLETPSAGVPVTVSQPSGPLSIWSATTTPSVVDAPDPSAVELGMRFRSDISGFITGVRFYKGPTNTGTHVGNLWDSNGKPLATATFTSETASGWQQVTFAQAVPIAANTTYIVSYHTDAGNYAVDVGGFAAWSRQNANDDDGPLHALTDLSGSRNGVYQYGPGGFPNNISPDSSNYWVDVVFATNANVPPAVTGETPVPNAEGVPTNTTVTATFSESVQSGTISFVLKDPSNNTVSAMVNYNDTTHTATLTPSAALSAATTYTATVSGATATNGSGTITPVTWSFSTTGLSSLWSRSVTPTVASANDPNAVELGVKFRSDVAGSISGLRFYKGPSNTGTHVGHLWTSSGTLLATATFSGETSSGWQQVTFAQPVPIAANTTYVASYFAPAGGYAVDSNYFATAGYDNAPLHALRDGVDRGDGVYAYGSGNTFPTGSYQSDNYWVDVVFITGTQAQATHLNVSAPASATAGAPFNVTVTALSANNVTATGYTGMVHFTSSDGQAVLPANYTFTAADAGVHTFSGVILKTAGSQTVTATDTVTASITGSATVTVAAPAQATHLAISAPASATAGAPFSVTVTALSASNGTATGYTGTVHFTSSDGQAVLPANYTFTAADAGVHTFSVTLKTAGSQTVTATDTATSSITGSATVTVTATANFTIWSNTATPSTPDGGPDSPVEVGVKFRSDVAGSITGVRFYKSSGNTGTHIGNLWSSTGQLLATATFSGETASGWQQVNFATPVAITANTVYVASYHTNVGHYADDPNYFASSGVDNAPLHALADGASGFDGVYAYGSTSVFPTNGWQASNYWVDVVFTDPPPSGTAPSATVAAPSATVAAPSATVAAPSATVAAPSVSSPSRVADPPTQKLSHTVQVEGVSSTSGSVAAGGTFMSTVLDEGQAATWDKIFVPKVDLPPGVRLVVEVRTGNTPTPDPTWSAFSVVNHGDAVPNLNANPHNPHTRYLQYRVSLNIPPGKSLRLPIPFDIEITSAANSQEHEPSRTDQVESPPAPVSAPVLAGNPGVSPTKPVESPEVHDAGPAATWKSVSWTANLPPGATLVVEISTGNTQTPDRTWSAWSAVSNGGEVPTPARYLRYRVRVLTASSSLTTVPVNISLTSNASGVSPVKYPGSTIGNRSVDATA